MLLHTAAAVCFQAFCSKASFLTAPRTFLHLGAMAPQTIIPPDWDSETFLSDVQGPSTGIAGRMKWASVGALAVACCLLVQHSLQAEPSSLLDITQSDQVISTFCQDRCDPGESQFDQTLLTQHSSYCYAKPDFADPTTQLLCNIGCLQNMTSPYCAQAEPSSLLDVTQSDQVVSTFCQDRCDPGESQFDQTLLTQYSSYCYAKPDCADPTTQLLCNIGCLQNKPSPYCAGSLATCNHGHQEVCELQRPNCRWTMPIPVCVVKRARER